MIIGITGNIGAGKDTVAKMIQYYFMSKINNCEFSLEDFLNNNYNCYVNNVNDGIFDWQIKKFAYKLKLIASILVGCNVEDFESQEFKDEILPAEFQPDWILKDTDDAYKPRTNRWLLQTLGTEAIRDNIHKNTWINALFVDYKLYQEETTGKLLSPNWIISDVRFQNEADSIWNRNGIVIKVSRGISESSHSSETELNSIIPNFHIENDGTIEELYEKVCSFLEKSNL